MKLTTLECLTLIKVTVDEAASHVKAISHTTTIRTVQVTDLINALRRATEHAQEMQFSLSPKLLDNALTIKKDPA